MSIEYGPRPLRITLTALVVLAIGALMTIGGCYLVMLGGSWYYLVAGVGLLGVAGLLFARRRAAIGLYALLLLATLAWTVYEVSFDWWQLAPRIDLWCILGLWLMLPFVNRYVGGRLVWRDAASGLLGVGLLAGALMAGFSLSQDYHSIEGQFSDSQMQGLDPQGQAGRSDSRWPSYGGSGQGDRYSTADLITPQNVDRLEKAWEFHTGDLPGPNDPGEFTYEVTPLKVGNSLHRGSRGNSCSAGHRLRRLHCAHAASLCPQLCTASAAARARHVGRHPAGPDAVPDPVPSVAL
jgi:quinoprotein glucose dehydrogenase